MWKENFVTSAYFVIICFRLFNNKCTCSLLCSLLWFICLYLFFFIFTCLYLLFVILYMPIPALCYSLHTYTCSLLYFACIYLLFVILCIPIPVLCYYTCYLLHFACHCLCLLFVSDKRPRRLIAPLGRPIASRCLGSKICRPCEGTDFLHCPSKVMISSQCHCGH